MKSIVKSIKVLSYVIDIVLGSDFSTPAQKTQTDHYTELGSNLL
jgi:hypothetical protein